MFFAWLILFLPRGLERFAHTLEPNVVLILWLVCVGNVPAVSWGVALSLNATFILQLALITMFKVSSFKHFFCIRVL